MKRKISNIVRNCDLLVHEATIGPIPADVVPKEGLGHMSIPFTMQMNSRCC